MAKVTVMIDDKVWQDFRKQVFEREGTLRKLSAELSAILEASSLTGVSEALRTAVAEVVLPGLSWTPAAIEKDRPTSPNSSWKLIREERDQR
ncbi:MAG: hypothetical protein ACFFGZ_11080 [Candidatus Thorarchaeota archaeon]